MSDPETQESNSSCVETMLVLGKLGMDFARVERMPKYPDGRAESDVEHSYMLSMVATQLAVELYPDLNPGLVGQFCIVHDWPEVIVGDTPTLAISDDARAAKEAAEAAAVERLLNELPKYWSELLIRYEAQTEAEARFVRMVDKLMPLLVDIAGNGQSVLGDAYGITTAQQLRAAEDGEAQMLRARFPEFEDLHVLFMELSELRVRTLFPGE